MPLEKYISSHQLLSATRNTSNIHIQRTSGISPNNMIRLLLLFVAVVTALGSYIPEYNEIFSSPELDQSIKPCQTTSQWEGRSSEWDHITESNNRYRISFDGVGLRKRILKEKKSFIPGERQYEYIMEYKTKTLYTININTNYCTVTNLTAKWQNHTIPDDATLEDEYEMGSPGSGFMVREWSDRLPARRAESWIGIFTIDGCWPVVEVFTDEESSPPVSLTTRFFDLVPGIANMSVFTPPAICKETDERIEFQPELEFDPPVTNQFVPAELIIDGTEDDGPAYSFIRRGWNYLKSWL